MSLQFFNFHPNSGNGRRKQYARPDEIMKDPYLTPAQKRMVLEAMLCEIRDQSEDDANISQKRNAKLSEQIVKAQSTLKGQMD